MEKLYSDSMDARVMAGGKASQVRDMSTEDLLRTVAVAATVEGLAYPGLAHTSLRTAARPLCLSSI